MALEPLCFSSDRARGQIRSDRVGRGERFLEGRKCYGWKYVGRQVAFVAAEIQNGKSVLNLFRLLWL